MVEERQGDKKRKAEESHALSCARRMARSFLSRECSSAAAACSLCCCRRLASRLRSSSACSLATMRITLHTHKTIFTPFA